MSNYIIVAIVVTMFLFSIYFGLYLPAVKKAKRSVNEETIESPTKKSVNKKKRSLSKVMVKNGSTFINEEGEFKWGQLIWMIPLAIFAIIFVATMFLTVPAGYRGVHLRFGEVVGVYDEGLGIKVPFIDSVVRMSVQTELYEEPNATAASRDLQDVKTSVALNYKVDPAYVGDIYRTLGLSYIDRIARPAIQETVKEITAKYDAEDMIIKRAQVKDAITKALADRLRERGIIAETVSITNFEFSQEFTKAIEAKVVAVQKVMEAENKLRQIEVEARQAEQKAKGDAAAAIARAEGQAEATRILSESLTETYLQYIYIDKLAPEADVIVVPEGMPMVLPSRK